MITNQVIQKCIDRMKDATGKEFAVMDLEGAMVAATLGVKVSITDEILTYAKAPAGQMVSEGSRYSVVKDEGHPEYIVLTPEDENAPMLLRILEGQIQELIIAYKERFDKENFIKNLLLDNLLMVDIYNRSKKLHINAEARRVIILLEVGLDKVGDEMDRVMGLVSGKNDFVTAVDETNIIVVKELSDKESYREVERSAKAIGDTFADRGLRVSYGTIVDELKDLSRSYKEAAMALDVGKIFFKERSVIAYSTLGIGRLIYQLPIPLCKMFISEIFAKRSPDDFDEETLATINKFFENSLNVSETARQLYIHRNTLVYRLDKLQKSTGLDLRVFEDAITFKIALMVVEYMSYMEDQDF